jgi:hypothetical protein
MVSVIHRTTVAPVVDREVRWTERGLASAIAAHEGTTTFRILRVGLASGADLDEWRRRVL